MPTRVLSVEQRDAVELWFREAAPVLLLGDWSIDVEQEPPPEDADAEVGQVGSHLHARVRVDAELLRRPASYVRRVFLHELLHLHVFEIEEPLRELAEENLDEAMNKVHASLMARGVERVVDQLARVLDDSGLPWPSLDPVLKAAPLPDV